MPSTGLVPNVGEAKMLEIILGLTPPQNLVLHLFKNNITPASTMVLSDYTEATFTGYAAVTLSSANWTVTAGGPTTVEYTSGVSFTCSGTTSESVYGFYLTDALSSALMWSERFDDAPFVITYPNDALTPRPKLNFYRSTFLLEDGFHLLQEDGIGRIELE
jgi:hypothetical protein